MKTQAQIIAREHSIGARVHSLEDLSEEAQREILAQIARTDPYTAARVTDILATRRSVRKQVAK